MKNYSLPPQEPWPGPDEGSTNQLMRLVIAVVCVLLALYFVFQGFAVSPWFFIPALILGIIAGYLIWLLRQPEKKEDAPKE